MAYRFDKEDSSIVVDIKGLEGLYAVMKDGRVWSYPKKQGSGQRLHGQFLKTKINKKDGYCYITFGYRKKNITRKIHRLVAEAYIPNPENKAEVNHINGIKTDNRVENLEWCTRQENATHARKTGLMKKGEDSGNSKLTEPKVLEIRALYKKGVYSQKYLGQIFGVGQATIHKIIHNQRWAHI